MRIYVDVNAVRNGNGTEQTLSLIHIYTYGTFPPESHLQVKGHSRGNFSVKWVKKTKQYLEIASAAGLLRLTPITPSTIRISFVKGVTGTIQDTNWKAQADTAAVSYTHLLI